jgi:hypothetical protein
MKAVIALVGRRDAGKNRRLIASFGAALTLSTICWGESAMLLSTTLVKLKSPLIENHPNNAKGLSQIPTTETVIVTGEQNQWDKQCMDVADSSNSQFLAEVVHFQSSSINISISQQSESIIDLLINFH